MAPTVFVWSVSSSLRLLKFKRQGCEEKEKKKRLFNRLWVKECEEYHFRIIRKCLPSVIVVVPTAPFELCFQLMQVFVLEIIMYTQSIYRYMLKFFFFKSHFQTFVKDMTETIQHGYALFSIANTPLFHHYFKVTTCALKSKTGLQVSPSQGKRKKKKGTALSTTPFSSHCKANIMRQWCQGLSSTFTVQFRMYRLYRTSVIHLSQSNFFFSKPKSSK